MSHRVCNLNYSSQRTVTTVTQSSSSCFSSSSSSNFQNFENFQNCQNVTWSKNTPSSAAPVLLPQKSTFCPTAKATPSATSPSSSSSSSSFEQTVLEEHNRLRARHSAQPLKLNPAISRYAQEWANVSINELTLRKLQCVVSFLKVCWRKRLTD